MKHMSVIIMMAAVLAVLLAAGCTSTPEKQPSNQSSNQSDAVKVNITEPQNVERYVELIMIDESKVGGKYVSESAAFVTIVPMYVISKDGYLSEGSGKEVAIKVNYIGSIVNIDEASFKEQIKKLSEVKQARQIAEESAKAEAEAFQNLTPSQQRKAMTTKEN